MNEQDRDTQTDFMPPAEGGSYRRNQDGTLTRTNELATNPAPQPTDDEQE